MARIGQNLSDVEKEDMERGRGWRALKPGPYEMIVTESEYKETADGRGMCLWLFVQCLDPQHSRSKWKEFLTLEHPNPTTVKIAKAQLKALAIAVGHPDPDYVDDSEELHNLPFVADVLRERAREERYGDVDGFQNRIGNYKPATGTNTRRPAATPRYTESNPPPPTDDDLPF